MRRLGPLLNSQGPDHVFSGFAVFDRAGVIASSFNVSSITDNGTGDWTVNWTIAFASTGYAVVGSTQDLTAAGSVFGIKNGAELTTTSVNVRMGASNGAGKDCPFAYVAAIGRR